MDQRRADCRPHPRDDKAPDNKSAANVRISSPSSTPRRIWSSSIDFEQRLEIAFAEALVALALDDLEEDRADRRSR